MDVIADILTNNPWAQVATAVIAMANAITAVAPSKIKDNETYNTVMNVLNWASLNILKNKNADDKEVKK